MSEPKVVMPPCEAVIYIDDMDIVDDLIYFPNSKEPIGRVLRRNGNVAEVFLFGHGFPEEMEIIWERTWNGDYSEREKNLIKNCEEYAASEQGGLPGHALMLLVARMASDMDQIEREYIT